MKPPFGRSPLMPFDPQGALDEAAKTINAGTATYVQQAVAATSRDDVATINKIVARFVALCEQYGVEIARDRGAVVASSLATGLDLCLCHHRTPLNLYALLIGSDDDLSHDVVGITRNLDRLTGELREGFKPRNLRAPN